MQTFFTIVAIIAGIAVIVGIVIAMRKATQMPNQEPRGESKTTLKQKKDGNYYFYYGDF